MTYAFTNTIFIFWSLRLEVCALKEIVNFISWWKANANIWWLNRLCWFGTPSYHSQLKALEAYKLHQAYEPLYFVYNKALKGTYEQRKSGGSLKVDNSTDCHSKKCLRFRIFSFLLVFNLCKFTCMLLCCMLVHVKMMTTVGRL